LQGADCRAAALPDAWAVAVNPGRLAPPVAGRRLPPDASPVARVELAFQALPLWEPQQEALLSVRAQQVSSKPPGVQEPPRAAALRAARPAAAQPERQA
jgi:hypothetical protein